MKRIRSYWALVEPYWEKVSIYDGPARFRRDFAGVPERTGHLLAAHWAQSEICNGGFDQFFWNSTGVLAPESVAGFQAIGMKRTAALIAKAMEAFGPKYPRGRTSRWIIIRKLRKKSQDGYALEHLEDRFYRLIQEENGGWESAATRYAKAPNNKLQRTRGAASESADG